jgi:carboxypeptidase C (cathepsin A)
VDNQESWLTFTDLVFIDPVGTGFSRALDKTEKTGKESKDAEPEKNADNKEFYGLNRDLDSLCEFISKFLSKHRLWSRPIFIVGESYGGFRVAKLARKLQESYGVGLNGAILISPALELNLLNGSDYDVLSWTDAFPSLALAAAHHGKSRAFPLDTPVETVRAAAEAFATREMLVLLAQGEQMEASERASIAARMADFLGLDPKFLAQKAGRLGITAFVRELLREDRRVCGLYDATATSVDPFPDRDQHEGGDPTLFAIERVFTSGINIQLRENLRLETDRDYRLLNLEVNSSWKIDDPKHFFEAQIGATDDLRYGMALNPHMKVFLCHGLYDLVTPYFASERISRLLKLHPSQRDSLITHYFSGGHMFYTWESSRQEFHQAMESFFEVATRKY